jgi:tRNA threonylcarbamoyladenosine biosynthesis protein TsaB
MDVPQVVLSIETATRGGSIVLSRGEAQLAIRKGNPQLSQSSSLLSDINGCLDECGLSLADVDLFACASGPGSFTGLRIGIATVKALAASLKRPCVGIPTLRAVAYGAGPAIRTVALLPAGRGEIFAQMFSVSDGGNVTEGDTAAHLSPERLLERYATFADLTWASSGAEQFSALRSQILDYKSEGSEQFSEYQWRFAAPVTNLATQVAALARQALQAGQLESPAALSAIYVRPSDAELNQRCR